MSDLLSKIRELRAQATGTPWVAVEDPRDWLRAVRIDKKAHRGVVCVAKTYRGVRSTFDAALIVLLVNHLDEIEKALEEHHG